MSSEDIKLVEQTLINLLVPDNNLRKSAEAKLNELQGNKPMLIYCLTHVLMDSINNQVKVYAAVIIRKLLEIKESDIGSAIWKDMDANIKEQIKINSFKALISINDRSLKFKVCDSVSTICENIYELEEQWPDLLTFIIEALKLELAEHNLLNIETGLYLLSNIFGFVYEEMSKGIDLYVAAFKNYFSSNIITLKTKTVQAITEILCIVRKKDSKKFKDLIFYMLETVLRCLEDPREENNLKICITSISDLTNAEPNILRKHFTDLFLLMGRIGEKKDFTDENIRELAYEIIITMVEQKPTLFTKDTEKLKIFIEAVFKYSMEIEDEITDDWKNPKTESYFDEEFIPEEKLGTTLSIVDRLILAVGTDVVLAHLSDIVMQLLNNTANWRYKYIGFMTISQMVEHISDISHISNILPIIFADSVNPNPKIRFATLHCISQISDSLNPHFQNNYHEQVFPVVIQRVHDDVLRVQLQACDALQAYVESCSDQVAATYSQNILDNIFGVFMKDEIAISLKEAILNVTSELVTACDKNFTPYAERCLDILLKYFVNILNAKTQKSLYGILLDGITVIGPKCEATYMKFIPDLITAMVDIQNNIPNFSDPVATYLHSAWERLIPLIKDNFKQFAPQIIESALKLVTNVPTMSVSSQPENKFDIQALLGDNSGVKIEKKKIQVTTSETEDLSGCLELLNIIIETFSELYLPYVDITQTAVMPLLKYEINDSVRSEASNSLPELIEIIKKNSQTDKLHLAAKQYVSELVSALEKETDNAVIATFLDNLSAIVEKTGLFLTTPEINVLFGKLLEIFDKVEKCRLGLLTKRDKVEEELTKEQETGLDKINSDDEGDDEDDIVGEIDKDIEEIEEVLVSIADVMGSLFNTHKELTLQIVDDLLKNLLPKYFTDKASNFERKMGLFILDDMVEFLGQNLLGNIWGSIHSLILGYCDNHACELRQAACYGIGEFAKHTVKDYNLYVNDALISISKAIDINSDGEDIEEWGHARDNIIASLGKIIKYQNQFLDINVWIPKWLSLLPLSHDAKESHNQHQFLCEVIVNNSQLILGENNSNLPRIIRILSKIYETKFSNEEIDKCIQNIVVKIKSTPTLSQFIVLAKEGAEDKILKKINTLFQ